MTGSLPDWLYSDVPPHTCVFDASTASLTSIAVLPKPGKTTIIHVAAVLELACRATEDLDASLRPWAEAAMIALPAYHAMLFAFVRSMRRSGWTPVSLDIKQWTRDNERTEYALPAATLPAYTSFTRPPPSG